MLTYKYLTCLLDVLLKVRPDEIFGSSYLRMDQVKFFKGCLPQISPVPFLNTLTYL